MQRTLIYNKVVYGAKTNVVYYRYKGVPMDKKEEFKHYMIAGHGRAFKLLENNKEDFRDIALYGCLNDISFDMQCEGSRGYYMYNLVWEYGDSEYFLKQAVEKFLTDDINDDWHTICHLCDFIRLFAENDKDKNALAALLKKYNDLYSVIMSSRFSEKIKSVIESFEYVSITLMQILDFKFALKIFGDMGAYFIKRRRTPSENLKWLFQWFYSETKEKYGEEFLKKEIENRILNFKDIEIKRFYIIMNTDETKYQQTERPEPTAENVLKQIETDSFSPAKTLYFRRNAEQSEKVKLAEMILAENDLNKKAEMLRIYSLQECPFPLDPSILIEYANSENKSLRDTAAEALSCIRADCVRNFALKMISENNSADMLNVLIYNCCKNDRDIIFKHLDDLAYNAYSSDTECACNLHNVMFTIIDTAESIDVENKLLNELLIFGYEYSPCSCCRENIIDELARRNLMTKDMIAECRFDSNSEIRETVDNLNKILSENS